MTSKLNNQFIYFRLSLQYLHLVESVVDELIKQGNTNIVISDNPISEKEFYEKTKWGDFNIAEPLLFNFYHGLELLLKGYLKKYKINFPKNGHDLIDLFDSFAEISEDENMRNILLKYVGKDSELAKPLNKFFSRNKITVSKFYEALRYPETRNSSIIFSYDEIRYLGEIEIDFYINLQMDIDYFRKKLVKDWNGGTG